MSLPPPPSDVPPPGYGGGFGPPQGFGPPLPPAGGGYGPQPAAAAGHGGYGPPAPDGRQPFPPPPEGGGKGQRIAAVVVGAVVVTAIVLGGLMWLGSGGGRGDAATSGGSAPARAASPGPAPGAAVPGDGQPAAATGSMPYVKLDPGTCFDTPSLDSRVSTVTTTSCAAAHDGEVIADESLSGAVSGEQGLRSKALALCAPAARRRLESIPADGRVYYNYALYPDLATYQAGGMRAVSCALTLSDSPDGTQLTEPLP